MFGFFSKNKNEEAEFYGVVDLINQFREDISPAETNWELTKLQLNAKDRGLDILQWTNKDQNTVNVIRKIEDSSEIITIDIIKADNTHIQIGEFATSANESSKDLTELAIKRASMYMQTNHDVNEVSLSKA